MYSTHPNDDLTLHETDQLQDCSIVWFRNDLRISDHLPLTEACRRGKPVFAIYVFDMVNYEETKHYRFPKTGPHRARFIQQSVEELARELIHLKIPLFIRTGSTAESFVELLELLRMYQYKPNHMYYTDEVGDEEREIAFSCQHHLALQSCQWHAYITGDLYDWGQSPIVAQLPNLFTSFRNQIENHFIPPLPLPVPSYSVRINALLVQHIESFKQTPHTSAQTPSPENKNNHKKMNWIGGSRAGKARLHYYLFESNLVARYKETRNGLLSTDDSSRISAWLAQGCLSAREVYAELKRYEQLVVQNESTYWLFFELLWREYFRLVHRKWGNRMFRRSGVQVRVKKWETNPDLSQAWLAGNTGYPLVDASMRELLATGYTSNRARQNAASFLSQTWRIDWLYGAEWYESQLIDYDPASNYGNWQYLAGVGNDARQDRIFDVTKQAKQYDPDGNYVRYWLNR